MINHRGVFVALEALLSIFYFKKPYLEGKLRPAGEKPEHPQDQIYATQCVHPVSDLSERHNQHMTADQRI